jgi:hypothetical protein
MPGLGKQRDILEWHCVLFLEYHSRKNYISYVCRKAGVCGFPQPLCMSQLPPPPATSHPCARQFWETVVVPLINVVQAFILLAAAVYFIIVAFLQTDLPPAPKSEDQAARLGKAYPLPPKPKPNLDPLDPTSPAFTPSSPLSPPTLGPC